MTMASNRHNLLEEARPPERTRTPSLRDESLASISGLIQNEEVPILESLQNMATSSRKSHSCRSSLMRPDTPNKCDPRRPASLDYESAKEKRASMWRNSYHKDVEEALSSLLWEPYECRETQTISSNYWDGTTNSLSSDISSPLSSTTSSCNSLCDGRMECCAAYGQAGKEFPQSFTNDFIGCDYYRNGNCVKNVPGSRGETTSRSDSCLQFGKDKGSRPNLPTSFTDDFDGGIPGECTIRRRPEPNNSDATLVTNLRRVEGSWPSQSMVWTDPRDLERLSSDVGTGQNVFDAQFSECRRAARTQTHPNSSAFCNYYNSLRSASFSEIRTESNDGPVTTMRLSIPPNPGSITTPLVPNRVSLTTNPSSIQVQTSTEPAAPTPNHARTNSRPRSTTPATQTIAVTTPPRIPNVIPNHSRTNSQTGSRVQVPIVPNHNRNSSALSLQSQPTNRIQLAVNHSRTNSNSNPQNVRNSVPVFSQNIIHTRVPSLPGNLNSSVAPPANNNPGTSVNVVNCYRAVPVNVVSSVPTIKCLNSAVEPTTGGNNPGISRSDNVSNVQIVQTVQAVSTPVISSAVQPQPVVPSDETPVPVPRTRTFTSTEAQTDDTIVGRIDNPNQNQTPIVTNLQREHRRRERRDRRHQQRLANSGHPHGITPTQWAVNPGENGSGIDRLPDLLNSHLPPPYSTLPSPNNQAPAPILPVGVASTIGVPTPLLSGPIPAPSQMVQFTSTTGPFTQMPLVQGTPTAVPVPMVSVPTSNGGLRFLQFQNAVGMRRSRRGGQTYSGEDPPKSCCGVLLTQTVSIRWFIVMIAFVGVCCVVVGTILGAMKASGREHLTVSLLMIGVGIILVTVSGVAWRLTSHDAPTCRAMLGLSGSDDGTGGDNCARRFVPRLPPSYGRPHHPYAAMMYPEFQYRPPPPSYQASMQEYRLRLLLLDRHAPVLTPSGTQQHSVTPPPTYRSQSGSLLRAPLSNRRDPSQSEYSCPPSYRSRTSSNRPVLDPNGPSNNGLPDHSREHSLSLSDSNGSVVNVVSILTNQVVEDSIETISLDNVKVVPESDIGPLKMMLKSDGALDKADVTKDGNLVTIVQTSGEQSPVIVTVSGSQMSTNVTPNSSNFNNNNEVNSEMEILAHL